MNRCAIVLVVLAAMTTACGATDDQLRARAAFDLNCAKDQVTLVPIDDRTQGVTGCGQRATYVEACQRTPFNGQSCTWVLNGDARSNTAGAPPVAPAAPVNVGQ
jgi:hypothetical protein